jgi:two-component system sensor histidine kinase/response regulator
MMTAFDERGQRNQALLAGYAAYFTKPLRRSALHEALRDLTGARATSFPSTQMVASPMQREPGRHVLVAEDNPSIQRLLRIHLERLGATVEVVDDGRAAVEAVSQNIYNLVLMDLQMPELDGFTATAAIRTSETATGRHLPIIAITADAQLDTQRRCLAAGMDGFVSKPLRTDELRDVLDEWVPIPEEGVGH